MTFWDFCAPVYDFAEATNGKAYGGMLKQIRELVPQGSNVLEIAAGTGSISLAVADKATSVTCTDLSEHIILKECHAVARELDADTVAQAAARACGQAAACFHTPAHSLGLAFCGAAAIAYDRACEVRLG